MTVKTKKIPTSGIEGIALREAAAGDFHSIIRLVRDALAETISPGKMDHESWVDVRSIYPDRVVAYMDDRLWSYPYKINDSNVVEIGAGAEVVLDYKPVAAKIANAIKAQPAAASGVTPFMEALDEKGLKWRIKVVEAGLSGNKNFYPDAVLREALPLFDGARVFVKSDEEHLRGKGKNFNQLIGRLSNAAFVEGKSPDTGEVDADLSLLASAGEVPVKLREAYDRGMSDLFGFSMDAQGSAKRLNGKQVATKITKVASVDLIIEPGAGGAIINFIEAKTTPEGDADMKLREKMVANITAANKGVLPDGLDINDDDALEVAYREALAAESAAAADTGGTQPAAGVSKGEVAAQIRMVEARSYMRETINASKLPDAARQKLRDHFSAMIDFKEAQVDDAIHAESEYLAKFTESGKVAGMDGMRIENTEDRGKKVGKMLDAFFDPGDASVTSFKECYVDITGDRRVTGMLRDCDDARFRESLSDVGNLDVLLGDAIQRRMIADYRDIGQYDVFQPIIESVPISDFRTNHRTRLGGYGDLPTVNKLANYLALTSPGDEEATYNISKKGGLETIALEDIRNDDVGLIRRIPTKMSRAAKRTLAKFVLDFIRTNPLIYDGTALFSVAHGNLGAAALDPVSLAARRLAMVQQKELGSNEELGIGPKHLLVPNSLEEAATDLFSRTTNNDETFIQKMKLNILPVWYWTDPNDWALIADPLDIPGIEIGFLDGNEEPEVFIQDTPTVGSMFNNDSLTWKIRHIYGGVVKDYRGFDKSMVP